jgi:ATP-dependent Lon protease
MMNYKNVEIQIIKFQKKYKLNLKSLDKLNRKITYLQDILFNLVNNVDFCNSNKIFRNDEEIYLKTLNKIKHIKDKLKLFSIPLTLKKSYELGGITKIKNELESCHHDLTKIFCLVTPNNINYVFEHFLNRRWVFNFTKSDLEKIIFISQMFVPITVWDTKHHSHEIEILNKQNEEKKEIVYPIVIDLPKNNFTTLLTKNLLEMLNGPSEETKKENKREIIKYTNSDCEKILKNENIVITKNSSLFLSPIEEKNGAKIFIKIKNEHYMVFSGVFKDDILNIYEMIDFVGQKLKKIQDKINNEVVIVPKTFKEKFIKMISLRDLLVHTEDFIISELKRKYSDFKLIQDKSMIKLINEFLMSSKSRKIDILTYLMMNDEDSKKLGHILFDVLQTKDDSGMINDIYLSLHYSIREELDKCKIEFKENETKIKKMTDSDIPYEKRIIAMKTSDDVKVKAMEKLKALKNNLQGDNKAQQWLDGLLKIPFGVYKENPILSFKSKFEKKINEKYPDVSVNSENKINLFVDTLKITNEAPALVEEWEKYQNDKKLYINNVRQILDEAVYGHKEAKIQIERVIAQWINGEVKGAVLGLEGPPGTGKTSLAKGGLSKCLKDTDDNPRPFAFLPIGGSSNGSTLIGHNFTYVGSTWGRIADVLMTTQCMNPIIFIDEVDKISQTEYGREIVSVLTHLTDPTQNDEFEDKYFAGIKLDLSKALIVFSFNDVSLLDPILRDRITIIKTNSLSLQEKKVIVDDYLFPQILQDVGFDKSEIILPSNIVENIIEEYTFEAGVRKLKEKLFEIVRDINLKNIKGDRMVLPFEINNEFVSELFIDKPKIKVKKIPKMPTVGLVNGLYATTAGVGGLTVIQIVKYPSQNMLEISMTGSQGDVMKESVQYALKIAFSLLPKEKQDEILNDANNKKSFGLHVHTPDAATPKDGPSAGAAITLAIYSILANIPVNNEIAMTGEIDLCRNITAIGGVQSKLNGAKKAGAKIALIPKENLEDLQNLRNNNLSPESDDFKVIVVETIEEVFDYCLVKN